MHAKSPSKVATHRIDDVPRGILYLIAATFMFALTSSIAKYQVAHHPVGEVMFIRSSAGLIVCLMFLLPKNDFAVFRTAIPQAHIGRGLSQAISQTFTVMALGLLPLAGAIAINFSAPLWSALLSLIFLRERMQPARAIVLLIGFIGILIVVKPGADTIQLGAVYALVNAVMYGGVTVAVRGMTKTESADTLLIWQMSTVYVFHSFLLVFGTDNPPLLDIAIIALSGVTNAGGQFFWTRALMLAPATAVSPFYYLTLAWALIIGCVIWGDVPTYSLIIGAIIVVASALMLLRYERKAKAAENIASTFRQEPSRALRH